MIDRPASAGGGRTTTPLVVFVHGTMDRSTSFARTMGCLPDLHTMAYDRRGYARSSAVEPPAESLDDHVRDLLDVIDGRPSVVVGHSYGGDVGLAASIERPDVIGSVLVFEAPTPWVPWWPADSAGARAVAQADSPEDAAEAFIRRLVGDRTWERLPERTRAARRAEGPAVLTDLKSIRDDAAFDLDAVTVPVVVGSGSEGEPHHRECARRMAEALRDAELVEINGGAHGSHMTHPQQFAALVRQAIERSKSR